MAPCEIIDAFPSFLAFWAEAGHLPPEALVERWAKETMKAWPELLAKQVDDYERGCEDWRTIASERIFPYLGERLPAMRTAHRYLRDVSGQVYAQAQETLGFDSEAVFVIHAGIGCGAGWVTTYQGKPAILFGLENVAECGWSEPPALVGLVAHEIGHLAHFHWRSQRGVALGSGPWWQIYEEGFAQRCEHRVLGTDTWHMSQGSNSGWLAWCQAHRAWLAAEYLRAADQGMPVRPFFGSWHEIQGHSQTGYYLGHELIRGLESTMDLGEIATLGSGDLKLRAGLEAMAEGSS